MAMVGLAQINGRNNITWEQKFEYDLQYIDSGITFIGDTKIILRTIGKVIKCSDTVREGTVSDMDLGDWLMVGEKIDQETYDSRQAEADELLRVRYMEIKGWRYYNYAAIPSTPPHEEPDLSPVKNNSIWRMKGRTPLLARWTSDFDCGYETNWWYVIKDTPFDIHALKAKRRYEINKANRNFIIKEINPIEWSENIYRIAVAAYETYPNSYRPDIKHDSFISEITKWNFYKIYGAFSLEDESLCGYACLSKKDLFGNYIDFTMMKAIPEKEKLGINAAMVNKILLDHQDFLSSGGYICDGARSVRHETAFQDYLEKYFAFRKAYCKLHIVYKPAVRILINIAFPFRRLLNGLNYINVVSKVNALIKMEEINRTKV